MPQSVWRSWTLVPFAHIELYWDRQNHLKMPRVNYGTSFILWFQHNVAGRFNELKKIAANEEFFFVDESTELQLSQKVKAHVFPWAKSGDGCVIQQTQLSEGHQQNEWDLLAYNVCICGARDAHIIAQTLPLIEY